MPKSCLIPFLLLLLASCTSPPTQVYRPNLHRDRITRVNLRPEGEILQPTGTISRPNFVPVGTPARILTYSAKEIRLVLSGLEYTLVPMGTAELPTEGPEVDAFLEKYFVDQGEGLHLDRLGPADLAERVLSGMPECGMTKEQVYACLGPPLQVGDGVRALPLTREAILASDRWIYVEKWIVGVPQTVEFYFGQEILQKRVP